MNSFAWCGDVVPENRMMNRIEAMKMCPLRKLLQIIWTECIKNEKALRRANMEIELFTILVILNKEKHGICEDRTMKHLNSCWQR